MKEKKGFTGAERRYDLPALHILTGCLCLAAVLFLSSCGSSSSEEPAPAESAKAYGTDYAAFSTESWNDSAVDSASAYSEDAYENTEGSSLTERKLVRNVSINAETEDFDAFSDSFSRQVSEAGGYIESSWMDMGDEGSRSANYTARIPADGMDAFVRQVKALSNVTYYSTSTDDITLQYIDTDTRREALQTEQKTLLSMLEKAETVEDMLAIQSQLTEVTADLQNMQSQINLYDNQVSYAYVYLSISEVQKYTPPVKRSAWERIGSGFAESCSGLARGIGEFLIGFVSNLPYILFFSLLFLAVFKVVKFLRNRRGTRKNKVWKKKNVPVSKSVNSSETGDGNKEPEKTEKTEK